ncbi:MAG: hypothetical protein AAGI28_03225 [Pseudomonadota bacterium]
MKFILPLLFGFGLVGCTTVQIDPNDSTPPQLTVTFSGPDNIEQVDNAAGSTLTERKRIISSQIINGERIVLSGSEALRISLTGVDEESGIDDFTFEMRFAGRCSFAFQGPVPAVEPLRVTISRATTVNRTSAGDTFNRWSVGYDILGDEVWSRSRRCNGAGIGDFAVGRIFGMQADDPATEGNDRNIVGRYTAVVRNGAGVETFATGIVEIEEYGIRFRDPNL